jgi:ABC-type Zn2+ transport system substrate-binding protein/surface adhesin
VKAFLQKVKTNHGLLGISDECQISSVDENFSELLLAETHSHGKQDDHHDHYHDHDHEHDHDHNKEHGGHIDVEFTYGITCQTLPTSFSATIFDHTVNLKSLSAQWITDSGQGAKMLSAQDRVIPLD